MAKSYQKPVLVFENFVLNDYIAACNMRLEGAFSFSSNSACNAPPSTGNSDMDAMLGFLWYDGTMFLDSTSCFQSFEEDFDDIFAGEICFHNSTGSVVFYGS